jgi:hypothetical protein
MYVPVYVLQILTTLLFLVAIVGLDHCGVKYFTPLRLDPYKQYICYGSQVDFYAAEIFFLDKTPYYLLCIKFSRR